MATGYGLVTELGNDAIERGSARAAGDAEDTRTSRRNLRDRTERAPARMSPGTCTPGADVQPGPGHGRPLGLAAAAGIYHDFGRCPSRYHKAEYLEVLCGPAAAGTPDRGRGILPCTTARKSAARCWRTVQAKTGMTC